MISRADSNLAMAVDFRPIVEQMKLRYNLRIRKWRRTMSGCAWSVYYHDGKVLNWIEAPFPRTPISLAIFLHECGHHAIGFGTYRKRCEEEYHAWMWAMAQMRLAGVAPDEKVRKRFQASMRYAVSKAVRRGITDLPEPLRRFAPAQAA